MPTTDTFHVLDFIILQLSTLVYRRKSVIKHSFCDKKNEWCFSSTRESLSDVDELHKSNLEVSNYDHDFVPNVSCTRNLLVCQNFILNQ